MSGVPALIAVVSYVQEHNVSMRNIERIVHTERAAEQAVVELSQLDSNIRFKIMPVAQARTLKRYVYGGQ